MSDLTEKEVLDLIAEAAADSSKSEAQTFVDALASRTHDVPAEQLEPQKIVREGQIYVKDSVGRTVELPSVTTAELHHGHVPPEKRAEIIADAEARKQQTIENVKRLQSDIEEAYWKKLSEDACTAPVNQQGRSDHKFLEALRGCFSYKDEGKTQISWKDTYYLRDWCASQYETGKTVKPLAPGEYRQQPTKEDVARLVGEHMERRERTPVAKNNRYVR